MSSYSPTLQRFIDELPLERGPIAAFVARAARETAPGSRVLDAGAGDAPYAELFAHCEYVTADWQNSPHERQPDIAASLDQRLPIDDEAFDAVVNTQVLEHLAYPAKTLAEFHRILRPGGTLWLSAPLVWELHEEPHDYYRYTSHGLRLLLGDAGFEQIEIEPRTGYFTTMALLARSSGAITDGGSGRRRMTRRVVNAGMRAAAAVLARLDDLDERRTLPLGWACKAVRPGAPGT